MNRKLACLVMVVVIVLQIAMVVCVGCAEQKSEPLEFKHYPLCGTVVEVNRENGEVVVEDFNGNLWAFEGCEDWLEGDICAMIMSDEATPDTIYDDVIIQARYCGWAY